MDRGQNAREPEGEGGQSRPLILGREISGSPTRAPPDDANVAAAKANLRTLKLTTFDHKTMTVALGRKPEEKN